MTTEIRKTSDENSQQSFNPAFITAAQSEAAFDSQIKIEDCFVPAEKNLLAARTAIELEETDSRCRARSDHAKHHSRG